MNIQTDVMVSNLTSAWNSDVTNVTNVTDFLVPEGCIVFPVSVFSPWYNTEDLMSFETQQIIERIVDAYLLILFFVVSVPLNIINMVVFWKHGIKERINLCLFFLSLADVIIVLIHFELELDRIYSVLSNSEYELVVAKFSVDHMFHFLLGFIYVSGFMSTIIALERCLCVVSPLRAQGMLQTKTTAVIILIGHIVILGGHHVINLRWKIVCMYDPLDQRPYNVFYSSQFYIDNKQIMDIFESIAFGILIPGSYVTGVTVCTVVTVIKLRQSQKWRQQSSSANASGGSLTKDVNLTRMLIGTSVLFVGCTTPPLVFHTCLPFIPDLGLTGKYYNLYNTLFTMQQLCYYINSSFNFFVYYFLGTKFRATVKHMFRHCAINTHNKKKDSNLNT